MLNIIKKVIIFFKRPSVVFMVGDSKELIKDPLFKIKEIPGFLVKNKDIFFVDSNLKEKNIYFLAKRSFQPVLAINHHGEPFSDERVFELARVINPTGCIILNSESGLTRRIRGETKAHILNYGSEQGVDFQVTDINILEGETNFKINYEGDVVPFWFSSELDKKEIYGFLAAIAIGVFNGINLVQISQILKGFKCNKSISSSS